MIIAVREATVGPLLGLMLVSIGRHADVVVVKPQRLRGNLAKDGVGSLAELRARDHHPQAARGRRFHAHQRIEIAFPGSGKTGAMQKGRDADAFLLRAGWVCAANCSTLAW